VVHYDFIPPQLIDNVPRQISINNVDESLLLLTHTLAQQSSHLFRNASALNEAGLQQSCQLDLKNWSQQQRPLSNWNVENNSEIGHLQLIFSYNLVKIWVLCLDAVSLVVHTTANDCL